jgi:hypothetical protein
MSVAAATLSAMSIQPALFSLAGTPARPDTLAEARSQKERGAVFTRQSVVDFMLDLAGYLPTEPLHQRRLLEPSFGGGRFVLAAAQRLIAAWRAGEWADDDSVLDDAIRAVELDPATFEDFQPRLIEALRSMGVAELSAQRLAKAWLVRGDFLLADVDGRFDVIVGNPPYVRQELLDQTLLAQYRSMFSTMIGRADIYVPFFEKSLSLLAQDGKLCLICSDAWTKNDYGRSLRALVSGRHALRAYVDMYGVDAFESGVGAYPSITLIANAAPGTVATARAVSADAAHLGELLRALKAPASSGTSHSTAGCPELSPRRPEHRSGSLVTQVAAPPPGPGPWLLRADRKLDGVRAMEEHCGTLVERKLSSCLRQVVWGFSVCPPVCGCWVC